MISSGIYIFRYSGIGEDQKGIGTSQYIKYMSFGWPVPLNHMRVKKTLFLLLFISRSFRVVLLSEQKKGHCSYL